MNEKEYQTSQTLTPQKFAEQMGALDIPKEDLDLIYEVGLDMEMDPRDIFDFAKNSDIREQLITRQITREQMESRLLTALPFDDVAKRAKETGRSFRRFVIIMALRAYERLQYLKERGLDFEGA